MKWTKNYKFSFHWLQSLWNTSVFFSTKFILRCTDLAKVQHNTRTCYVLCVIQDKQPCLYSHRVWYIIIYLSPTLFIHRTLTYFDDIRAYSGGCKLFMSNLFFSWHLRRNRQYVIFPRKIIFEISHQWRRLTHSAQLFARRWNDVYERSPDVTIQYGRRN